MNKSTISCLSAVLTAVVVVVVVVVAAAAALFILRPPDPDPVSAFKKSPASAPSRPMIGISHRVDGRCLCLALALALALALT